MRKIVLVSVFIIGLLLMACVNSTSSSVQSTENPNPDNTPAPLFTPEEIAYNDSIKDLPMDYEIYRDEYFKTNDLVEVKDPRHRVTELTAVTQEKAYLIAYEQFCEDVILGEKMFSSDKNIYDYLEIYVDVFDCQRNDISYLVDFPQRQEKEADIWNRVLKKYIPLSERKKYSQPEIKKGENLYAGFWIDDSIKEKYESMHKYADIVYERQERQYSFTKREISQNELIKNIPRNYILCSRLERIPYEKTQEIKKNKSKELLTNVTQEEAYLKAYKELCEDVAYFSYSYGDTYDYLSVSSSFEIYDANNDWVDITPLIDFPEREKKEKRIWIQYLNSDVLPRPRRHLKQPIIKKGNSMSVELRFDEIK